MDQSMPGTADILGLSLNLKMIFLYGNEHLEKVWLLHRVLHYIKFQFWFIWQE